MSQETKIIDQAVKVMADREGKYLSFQLAEEDYGINILTIREIIGMMPITAVPRMPAFVKGVINLRGRVIPIIDLRLRFEMPPQDYNERTCIIVVEVCHGEQDTHMGIVVDAVSEVLNVLADEIEPPPSLGVSVESSFVLGMAKMEGGVKMLLDINRVLTSEASELIDVAV